MPEIYQNMGMNQFHMDPSMAWIGQWFVAFRKIWAKDCGVNVPVAKRFRRRFIVWISITITSTKTSGKRNSHHQSKKQNMCFVLMQMRGLVQTALGIKTMYIVENHVIYRKVLVPGNSMVPSVQSYVRSECSYRDTHIWLTSKLTFEATNQRVMPVMDLFQFLFAMIIFYDEFAEKRSLTYCP